VGGDDEFQGLTKQTFTRPDGTQLGTQGDLTLPVASDMKLKSYSALQVAPDM
jgi:hypothetical protein